MTTEDSNPFQVCPQCGYDLRGNQEAHECSECGTHLMLNEAQKELYWVTATTGTGAIAKLLRSPLRMIPIALFVWLVFGMYFLAEPDAVMPDFYISSFLEGFAFTLLAVALFFTLAVVSGLMVQGLQPKDENLTEASVSVGNGFILRWMTRGWGRWLFWLAWFFLLLGIVLFYSS
ncbi:MAG: hypothetical protein ACPGYV_00825 [Phycisphaeraceae bacterium]